MPFEVTRCLLEQAVLMTAERPELPATAAQQSLAIFENLGARCYAERAQQLLRGLGIPVSATSRARTEKGILSARELEIRRLAARGLTTTETASRLFLSPRTISNHLYHIYDRLGIGSRTALARYVLRLAC